MCAEEHRLSETKRLALERPVAAFVGMPLFTFALVFGVGMIKNLVVMSASAAAVTTLPWAGGLALVVLIGVLIQRVTGRRKLRRR